MLDGKTEEIAELLDAIRREFGPDSIEPYGDYADPLTVGFRVRGIPATFSVITEDRLPERHYNIQIESYPPLSVDYLYINRAISLWSLVDLVKRMSGPTTNWPQMRR
jgi:hypothetical protein